MYFKYKYNVQFYNRISNTSVFLNTYFMHMYLKYWTALADSNRTCRTCCFGSHPGRESVCTWRALIEGQDQQDRRQRDGQENGDDDEDDQGDDDSNEDLSTDDRAPSSLTARHRTCWCYSCTGRTPEHRPIQSHIQIQDTLLLYVSA